MKLALGLIETKGLVAAIEAADVMLKTADVKLLGKEKISEGFVIIKVVGEIAAVQVAIETGASAAQRVGQLISSHIIPKPAEQVDKLIFSKGFHGNKENNEIKDEMNLTTPTLFDKISSTEIKENNIDRKKKLQVLTKEEDKNKSGKTEREYLDEIIKDFGKEKLEVPPEEVLAKLNVHKLRHLARSFKNFPIKGREISRASRSELIAYFNAIR